MSEKVFQRPWEKVLFLAAVVAMFAALAFAFGSGAGVAQAEAAPRLNHTSVSVAAGKTATLKVAGAKSTVRWSSSNKGVVTVKASGKHRAKATLAGKRAGSATVRAKVGKRTLKAKVRVVRKASGNSNAGGSVAPVNPQQGRGQQPRTAGGKTIVVYWSGTGNTQRVANIIASHLSVTAYELRPAEPYTSDDLNFNDPNSRVVREYADGARTIRPALAESVPDWSSYDTVYLGYPIWWGQAPNLLYTFAESTDFSGKTVIPFCTSLSSPISDSATRLQRAANNTGTWLAGQRFGENASEQSITSWADSQK